MDKIDKMEVAVIMILICIASIIVLKTWEMKKSLFHLILLLMPPLI